MRERIEIRLSGSGGQGLLTAGVILAYAVGIGEGKNVVQTQSYGPEARGGASRSDIIVSDEEIYNLKPTRLDLLLCLNQESCDAFVPKLKETGLLVIDTDNVKEPSFPNFVGAPFARIAREKLGSAIVANIVALGYICAYTGLARESSLKKAIEEKLGSRHLELNEKAVKLGYELGKSALKGNRA
jgi:2-oxoglutarate ferredoxin oxidoreductase subunit gamma